VCESDAFTDIYILTASLRDVILLIERYNTKGRNIKFVYDFQEMDHPPQEDSSDDNKNIVFGKATRTFVPSVSADISLLDVSDSGHASVMGDLPSANIPNASSYDCKGCMPSGTDSISNFYPVTAQSATSCDENEQFSVLHSETTLSVSASAAAAECVEAVSPPVDSEPHSCTPIIVVGGLREEELKRGLEQRLGLVLSKLTRENDENIENVDDEQHRESLEVVSDHFAEDNVADSDVDQSLSIETGGESTATDTECTDTQHFLMIDIVQEMDEVEKYSYLSLVAYAMHQLFDYALWNQYVTFLLASNLILIVYLPLLNLSVLQNCWLDNRLEVQEGGFSTVFLSVQLQYLLGQQKDQGLNPGSAICL